MLDMRYSDSDSSNETRIPCLVARDTKSGELLVVKPEVHLDFKAVSEAVEHSSLPYLLLRRELVLTAVLRVEMKCNHKSSHTAVIAFT